MDDFQLLRDYVEHGSEAAFEVLVNRYLGLVHSAAMRQVQNPQMAEEVAQVVFLLLANKAGRLSRHVVLSGWLFQTTRFVAARALRSEQRRHRHEQEAFQMQEHSSSQDAWRHIAPLLDEAIAGLGETDRNAMILRFFHGESLQKVGLALGISEAAAKKRVSRAVDKLRVFFARRGVAVSAAVLISAIGAHSVQAAPAGLAFTITTAAAVKGATVNVSITTLLKTTLKLMVWTKIKIAAVGAVILLVAGTSTIVVQRQHRTWHLPPPRPVADGQAEFPKDAWAFAGYDNPESAFQSVMWAANTGDPKILLASVGPVARQRLAALPENQVITAKDRADYARMTGYTIIDKQTVSEDEVIFKIQIEGLNQTEEFFMQRIGNEWKVGPKKNR